ncbi:hypothetical protein Tco_0162591 [Tanacetum coccineum]
MGSVHMRLARKNVRRYPTHCLAVRHSVDYSSSDHFSSDDSLRDSSSIITHTIIRPSHDSSSTSPSRKRSRSPAASVPLSLPIPRVLSYARANLLPSPKRIRSSEFPTDLEVSLVEDSEPSRYRGTDLEMDVDVTGVRGPVEVRVDRVTHPVVADDIPEPAQEGAVEVMYETLEDLVQREQDNMRLRDMMDVASQRVARSQRRELRVQREMRQIRHFRFYDRMRISRLEACARRHLTMPNTRSGASRTREGINEQIDRQMARALGARNAARNLEPLMRDGGGQEEVNGNGGNGNRGNRNGGNGNGNGNGGGNQAWEKMETRLEAMKLQQGVTPLEEEEQTLIPTLSLVMDISVISVSSDSSEESVGRSTGRVILFGTIPTTIPDTTSFVIPPSTHIDTALTPTSPDYTPASPDYSLASDMEFDLSEDPSSDPIPPLPATSPFLSSTDDSSGTSGALRRRVMVLAPGQLIPHGRPYRYHLNGPVHIMTARKRVGPLLTHHLAVRHLVNYSSLDQFSLDYSSRDSSSSPLSKTLSDSSADALSDSASILPSVHRSSSAISDRPSHDSSFASPYKRSRSLVVSVPLSSPILGALSYARANLLPSLKRIRSLESATDLEGCLLDSFEPYVPREARLGVDFEDESLEPSRSRGVDLEEDVDVVRSDEIDIDPEIQAEIDECIAYSDALRDRGIDARVVVEAIDREEIKTGLRCPIKVRVNRVTHPVVADDIPEPAQEGAVEVTYETLGDLVHRTMPNTRSGASRTRKGINEKINHQMAGVLGARNAARNLEPLMRDEGEQEEISRNGVNGNRVSGNRVNGNGNGGNGNGNGNGGGNGYNFGGFVPARECTYQDFLKCQPLSFNRTEGVVGLTCWFEKMETVFHISKCPEKYQVKYDTCTLLNSALMLILQII